MNNPVISIILLNYNTISFTEQCIESIIQSDSSNYEILVVDNNSNDKDKIKILEQKYQCVKVIQNEENTGFGAGNNLGVKHSKGKYIVILNNDTIVNNDTLNQVENILSRSEKKEIITGLIEGPDGQTQLSGGKEPKIIRRLLDFGLFLIKSGPKQYYRKVYFYPEIDTKKTNIDWATGCFFALRKSFYSELSGFDEKMFMYVEDVEFCKRARLNGGIISYQPELKIKHFGNQSSKNVKKIVLESEFVNTVYYFKKHVSIFSSTSFFIISKVIFLFWFTVFLVLNIFMLNKNEMISNKFEIYKTLLCLK